MAPLFVLLSLATAPAAVRLTYERGDTACPPRERLSGAVAARLGFDPFDDAAPDVVVVKVERAAGGLVARVLRKHGAEEAGTRELSSPTTDCSELFRALELAVAIAIDPRAGLVRPAPAPAPAPAAPTAPEPPAVVAPAPQPPPPPAPAPAPARATRFHAGLGLAGMLGTAPRPAAGLTALAGVRHGFFELDLGARVEQSVGVTAFGGTVSTQTFVGELSACAAWRWLRVCGLGAAGGVRVASAGFSLPDSEQTAALVFAGVRVAADVRLWRLFVVRPSLDFGATLARTRVVSEALVWATPPVMGGLGVAALWSEAEESQ